MLTACSHFLIVAVRMEEATTITPTQLCVGVIE